MKKTTYIDGIKLSLFDKVEVYRPQLPHIKKIVFVPGKVIYINRAADDDANVIKLTHYEDEVLEMLLDDLE